MAETGGGRGEAARRPEVGSGEVRRKTRSCTWHGRQSRNAFHRKSGGRRTDPRKALELGPKGPGVLAAGFSGIG